MRRSDRVYFVIINMLCYNYDLIRVGAAGGVIRASSRFCINIGAKDKAGWTRLLLAAEGDAVVEEGEADEANKVEANKLCS